MLTSDFLPQCSVSLPQFSSSVKVDVCVRDRESVLDVKMGHTLLCTLGLFYNPKPALNVSRSWLSQGASVTLNCSVTDSAAGWRFYWYKAVANLSINSNYSYELLPGKSNGTENNTYVVNGQTHTAGYVCRAGRGNPVHYYWYSKPKFVLTGDSHGTSVKVSPDRVQHFPSEPVSRSCEGNQWRVVRLTEAGHLSNCSDWGRKNGSTWIIKHLTNKTAVYWCEFASGEFSNAVNITLQSIPGLSRGSLLCQSPTKASTCVETQRKSQHRVGCQ
ncbi:uncharacterized protein LOC117555561 isoform X6 [Gymnodraco acuticeps]|uniref:Uncharacterized protein LOC117555561 isoform X6 n=1 Tax=Gymnodraco acuticeps TaxID=8218 RepID=A0A6P8WFX0_GYMAC|nr:uncharacterized protein LOC117555561 isoform X6 [Gymnodraco acuticeps]